MNSKTKRFLEKIKNIESSGGKNTDHKELKSGIHRGQAAIGDYGLMPNTISEIINRARINKELTPEMKELQSIDPGQLKEHLEQRRDIQDQLAQKLAAHVMKKQQGDIDRAAYGWYMGHNKTPNDVSIHDLNQSDYVRKFREQGQRPGMGDLKVIEAEETPEIEERTLAEIKSDPSLWEKLKNLL